MCIRDRYLLRRRLISKNGEKNPSARKIFLIQDEKKTYAVLRISDKELFPKKDHPSPLFPKVFGYGLITTPLLTQENQTLWYSAEEFIESDPSFSWTADSIEMFFLQYLKVQDSEYRPSTRANLETEVTDLISIFLKKHTISKLSKRYILEASQKYISERKHISKRVMYVDVIEENVLYKEDRYNVIDQEYLTQTHTPIIELFRFLYYHLAIYNHDDIAEKELTHEYAFLAMLLNHSRYSHLIRKLNEKYYQENEDHFPFLMTVMCMHEILLQEDNGMPITDKLLKKIDSLMHVLLYRSAPKQFFLSFSQRKVGEGKNMVNVNSELVFLRESLASIQSSKSYRVWQGFCNLRRRIAQYLGF